MMDEKYKKVYKSKKFTVYTYLAIKKTVVVGSSSRLLIKTVV
jgi:hypothetical protein